MNLKNIANDAIVWNIDDIVADDGLTREIQQRLTTWGYNPGSIDGIWGNVTNSAFVAFMKDQMRGDELSPQGARRLLQAPPAAPTPAPKPTPTPAPNPTPTPAPKPSTPTPSAGSPAPNPTTPVPTSGTPVTPPKTSPPSTGTLPPTTGQPPGTLPPKPTTGQPAPSPATPLPQPSGPPTPSPAATPDASKPAPAVTPQPKPIPTAPTSQALPANLRALSSSGYVWPSDRVSANSDLAKEIQYCLNAIGYGLGQADGLWGNRSQTAYASFCRAYQLKSTEVTPQAAQFLLEPTVPGIPIVRPPKTLTDSDYRAVAESIGCSVSAVRAVAEVEAAGSGFFTDGRPKILFEAHWFSAFTDSRYDNSHPNISSPVWNRSLYIGGLGEWDRLYQAIMVNRDAALKSASWGLGQVMGFNHPAAGYKDAESFVRDMHLSEGRQLQAMFNFIKTNKLDRFLINRDWAGFALRYNGESYRENAYDKKLADAYHYWANVG